VQLAKELFSPLAASIIRWTTLCEVHSNIIKQLSCQSWHRKRQVKYSEVFSPLSCSFFSPPPPPPHPTPSSRSFTSGLVLEWSRQPGQAAGRSMSEEAGTSSQALLLSCFSDIVGYALQVACICRSQMQYSGPNVVQRRVHNGMQSCLDTSQLCADASL
jgi:hypothetical protein